MLTTDQAGGEAARLSSTLPLGQWTILNQKQTLQTWTRRSGLVPDSRNVSYSMSKKKKKKQKRERGWLGVLLITDSLQDSSYSSGNN